MPEGPRCFLRGPNELAAAVAAKESLDELHVFTFQREACEVAAEHSACIEIDAIGPEIGRAHRRVPMNDDAAIMFCAAQERLADPHEVMCALLMKRDAGAHTCVAEEIRADGKAQLELFQKSPMF